MNANRAGFLQESIKQWTLCEKIACIVYLPVPLIFIAVSLGSSWQPEWLAISTGIFLAYIAMVSYGVRRPESRWWQYARDAAPVALMWIVYFIYCKAIFKMIPWNMDSQLHAIDTFLFLGHTPVLVIEKWSTPNIVESCSYIYALFIPFAVLVTLVGLCQAESKRAVFITGIVLLYALGFTVYYLSPAYGPIVFNAPYFSATLVGGPILALVKQSVLDIGGPCGAMPSLHTGLSAYVSLYELSNRRWLGRIYLIYYVCICLATVVLRYHYVIDVIAGSVLAWLVLRISKSIYASSPATES